MSICCWLTLCTFTPTRHCPVHGTSLTSCPTILRHLNCLLLGGPPRCTSRTFLFILLPRKSVFALGQGDLSFNCPVPADGFAGLSAAGRHGICTSRECSASATLGLQYGIRPPHLPCCLSPSRSHPDGKQLFGTTLKPNHKVWAQFREKGILIQDSLAPQPAP